MASGATFWSHNFSTPDGVPKNLSCVVCGGFAMLSGQVQTKFPIFRIGLSRFLSSVFAKPGVGSHPDSSSDPFRRIAPSRIFLLPVGNRSDRGLTVGSVVRLAVGFLFFGVGVWHNHNFSYFQNDVKHGWMP